MKGLQGMMKNLIDEVADSKEEAARLKYQLDKGKTSFFLTIPMIFFRKTRQETRTGRCQRKNFAGK